MDNIFDKFGVYDLFGMIVPGILISAEFLYLMPEFFANIIKKCESGIAGYFLFFVISYTVGIVFHELGTIWDEKAGLLRNTFMEDYGENKVISGRLDFEMANILKTKVLQKCELNNLADLTGDNKNYEETKFLYSYCVNFSEINGINGKSEKMQSTSEMSRSLFLGSSMCVAAYIFYGMFCMESIDSVFFLKLILLIGVSILFWLRNIRYRKYRIRSMIRTCFIAMNEKKDGESGETYGASPAPSERVPHEHR